MLEIRNVEKDFGGIKAVHDCSLQVKEGTITGLIGPNGAGKTTLFNIISGFYRPDRGEILYRGERIDGLPPHEIYRKGIMRTFQITRELQKMTVLENLMLIPKNQKGEKLSRVFFDPGGVRRQETEIKEKALAVLEFVELINLRDEYAANLSTGQKKLLEIARVLMSDAELVLLDEPGAGVNKTLLKKLSDNIRQLSAGGRTFFLIEHDMDLVMSLCDPIIVMSEGTKLTEGKAEDIRKDMRVLDAYLGV
ncbi:MAG: ABC transporter ATP-binding protein [Deferribacteres bacterium]|nr:ABC transporter ATP-binding protein [Deferribacteres bacterium]